jgi:4-hydroxy-tetrahydrodipicolinate reductase
MSASGRSEALIPQRDGAQGIPMTALRVAVAGASGRMGRMLVEAIVASPDLQLAGALDMAGSAAVGSDAAAFLGRDSGVRITADLDAGCATRRC